MPQYLYKHPKKNKYIEVTQTMSEEHTYTDKEGTLWERIFTVPQGLVKANWDHNDSRVFAHNTKHSRGNIGDLVDRAEELSAKRQSESNDGRDKLKDVEMDRWSKKRKGKLHPDDDRPKKVK
jgi:hypothetical protein